MADLITSACSAFVCKKRRLSSQKEGGYPISSSANFHFSPTDCILEGCSETFSNKEEKIGVERVFLS
jgi:hypothetical protein